MPSSNRLRRLGLVGLGLVALAASPARGADDEVSKLKDLLRKNTLALREAQDQNATLAAKQAQMTAELDAANKKLADADAAAKRAADLQAAVDSAKGETQQCTQRLEETQTVLGKWQTSYEQAATVAKARDAAARDFEAKYKESDARFGQCKVKNDGLEKVARELLEKLGDRGFMEAMEGNEPFLQLHRVELENLIQTYQDAMHDAEVRKDP
jgi:chromosome segregation ATPase